MKQKFRDIRLSKDNMIKLNKINSIIKEYSDDGYTMTLRQLYYQLVSRDIIPNQQPEYAKISKLLKEGRMGGIVDWNAIEDRLRIPYLPYWSYNPQDAINDVLNQYRLNRQKGQKTYIEVWVEKDALSGVLKRVTKEYHINLLVNRGYGSVTAIHDAYNRYYKKIESGINVLLLYLGDHDPSGMDMIRDIHDRITEMLINGSNFNSDFENLNFEERFNYLKDYESQDIDSNTVYEMGLEDFTKEKINERFVVDPIAITMEQIKKYNPPKNPAKLTDPRSNWYIDKYGENSWEVDALDPKILNALVSGKIEDNIDMELFNSMKEQEEIDKNKLRDLSKKL